MKRMYILLAGILVLGILGVSGAVGQPGKDPKDLERILKLFVDELVPIKPGQGEFPASFVMGSREGGQPGEKPATNVTLRKPFAIARYEVTQELYQTIMGVNPAKWKGPRNSVEMVSWNEANEFCQKLTTELRQRKLLGADEVIRLPSEAEWEYCCRAGTTTTWSFGDKVEALRDHAWYSANSKGEDPPVGRKKGNPWGLHEMHGYISEWCLDAWHPTYEGASTEGLPRVSANEKERVIRGGSFADPPEVLRCAARDHKALDFRSDRIGFRCVKASAK